MPNELALVDANVLVYAFYAEEERHAASRRLVDTAIEHSARLCLTSQVLAEFFSVITNPKRVIVARTPEDAIAAIELPALACCRRHETWLNVGSPSCAGTSRHPDEAQLTLWRSDR